ncbi:MAG: cupin domain-containing protein [Verrucomicrobiota bacterium]
MHTASKATVTPYPTPHGEIVYELIGRNGDVTETSSLARVELPPGVSSRPHYHPIAEETYYVLEGRGRVRIDGQERELAPGDSVLIRPGEHHQIECLGEETLAILCVCTPAWEPSNTVYLDE